MFFDALPNDLISHTIGFAMVGPPDVVSRKSIIAKMIRHDFACLSMRVSTFVARTPDGLPPLSFANALSKKASVLSIHSQDN